MFQTEDSANDTSRARRSGLNWNNVMHGGAAKSVMKKFLQTGFGLPGMVAICLTAHFTPAALNAGDWTSYRGSTHDGVSTETIRTNWSQEAPRQLWKVPLNPGLSSFTVSGGRLFTQVRTPGTQPTTEYCVALDADTGAQLWISAALGPADYPHGGVGEHDDGPRSTPVVDGDRVYVLTSYLKLFCLNAATGQEVWSKDLVALYGGTVIAWQNAASPLIEGDLILVNCNASNQRLLALRKQDGSEAWKGQNDAMTQATPVAASIAGVRQVVFFAQSGLVSVAPADGAVLWRYPFSYSTSSGASPVVGDDIVYCSAAYGMGAGATRITGTGSPLTSAQVWRKTGANMNHWATPVHQNGYVYGVYGQASSTATLRCIDLANGDEKWRRTAPVGMGAVLLVSGQLLVLTENGYLLLVRPDPTQYVEIASIRALDGSQSSIPGLGVRCWNVPAISNGRIYVRSSTEAVALDVAPPSRLKLNPALTSLAGGFHLLIGNEDNSPLDSNRVAKIDVFVTTDLTPGLGSWAKLTNSAVLINGQLRIDDAESGLFPGRFFRAEERP